MKLKRKSSSSQFSGYHIYVNREILPLNINTTYTQKVFSRKFFAAKIAICNLYKANIFRFQQDDFILSFFFPSSMNIYIMVSHFPPTPVNFPGSFYIHPFPMLMLLSCDPLSFIGSSVFITGAWRQLKMISSLLESIRSL